MSGGYGPVLLDFSPLGKLADTFFDARDRARKSRLEELQLQAPDEIAKIQAGAMGGASAVPSAPAAPSAPSMSLSAIDPQKSKAPTFAAMQGTEPSLDLKGMFTDKERQYALPTGYLERTAAIESRFNPNAQNPNSSAAGLFQFTNGTAKQYGLSDKFDPAASTDAAARLAADNRAYLSKVLGRDPTAGELYLAHQQGMGGAAKLLANPNARAVDVVGAEAVRLNGGDANMTAGEFAAKWASKVDGGASAPRTGIASGNASEASNLQAIVDNPLTPEPQRQWAKTQLSRAAPAADVPAPDARNAQYAIPGGQGQGSASSAAPQIQIPPQVQAALQHPNPYVRQWASKQLEGYQKIQQERAGKVWEHSLDQGNKDRTYGLEREKFDWDRNKPVPVSPNASLVVPGTGEVRYTAPAAPTGDMTEYNLYVQQAEARGETPEDFTAWSRGNKTAGATRVSVDASQKGEDKFQGTLAEGQAKRWNGYITTADEAQVRMADIEQMRELSRSVGSQGSSVNGKLLFGPYLEAAGISVDGLSDLQVYDALTKKLAPQMRAPGSGSTSDVEYKGFVAAIGPLSNQPAAREMILDTFEAAARNDLARGEIATRLATGEITRGQAEKELRALPNPMQAFREFRKANPDVVGQAIKAGRSSSGNTNNPAQIPQDAVKDLRAMPDTPQTRAQFDEIFGAGAAARILGGNR
jgi:hypothetical protein